MLVSHRKFGRGINPYIEINELEQSNDFRYKNWNFLKWRKFFFKKTGRLLKAISPIEMFFAQPQFPLVVNRVSTLFMFRLENPHKQKWSKSIFFLKQPFGIY